MMPLVRRTRPDETRAEFERFVDGCADGLLSTAYLIVWDQAEAEDLVQETLLRVAQRWPRVREMDQPIAYARRILVNFAIDGSKRRSHRRRELDSAACVPLDARPDEGATGAFGAIDVRGELLAALALLAPRQRAVLVLRYFEDLSELQTAETLGCSLGTVKSTASRGLARLRDTLEPDRLAAAAGATTAGGNGHLVSETKERQR
jgi:RNA polymerase sigma-70 factor (sigma-E family)